VKGDFQLKEFPVDRKTSRIEDLNGVIKLAQERKPALVTIVLNYNSRLMSVAKDYFKAIVEKAEREQVDIEFIVLLMRIGTDRYPPSVYETLRNRLEAEAGVSKNIVHGFVLYFNKNELNMDQSKADLDKLAVFLQR
jgi:hypothetical protein